MIKIAKALYYLHNATPFEGVIYASHYNSLSKAHSPEVINSILSIAPMVPEIRRANRELSDQFIYQFNHNTEYGILYAVVRFSEQMIFQLMAVGWDMDKLLSETVKNSGQETPFQQRVECRLKRRYPHP